MEIVEIEAVVGRLYLTVVDLQKTILDLKKTAESVNPPPPPSTPPPEIPPT